MTAGAATRAPLLGVLFYITLIMPLEFSMISIAGLRLSPYRIFLLVMFVPMVLRLLRESRVSSADYLVAAHALWAAVALGVSGGLAAGLESGGIYVVESFGAYLVGRLAGSSPETSRARAPRLRLPPRRGSNARRTARAVTRWEPAPVAASSR